MTDIVERLRERRKIKYAADCKCGKCQCVHIDDVYQAADEIERLRERLGPLGLEVVEINGSGHYVNAKVKAEIERLRDLVERANNLAHCVFKGETKADRERARHNATVLINDIARGRP